MPDERPFLTEPGQAGQTPGAAVPAALFDLAVNRAWAALRGLSPGQREGAAADGALAAWHARTRFARRVPLEAVRAALLARPPGEIAAGREWHWSGGPAGGWQPGRAPFP
ncbi:hypothetical protein [uncultured Deinococcus sp.]|uniref:hypothetical protein n=1 Tax=uncultured Deinococcus sp. TaxID=158789 RepID=UPI00258BC3EE|nr:hypothetical protein [uncultured Deinococcus sp.]